MKTDAYPHIHKKVTGEIFAVTEISKDGETWEDLPALQKKHPTMYQIAWVVMGHFTKCRIDIGNNITLRYQFWTQLHYEELLLREVFALAYYKLKGWI